jgi:hypothetical protein
MNHELETWKERQTKWVENLPAPKKKEFEIGDQVFYLDSYRNVCSDSIVEIRIFKKINYDSIQIKLSREDFFYTPEKIHYSLEDLKDYETKKLMNALVNVRAY